MKYSPVLLLGLMPLVFGSTAHAKDSLTFKSGTLPPIASPLDSAQSAGSLSVLDAAPALRNETHEPTRTSTEGADPNKDLTPFDVDRLNQPPTEVSARTSASEADSALPALPLFELPPFQAPSSDSSASRRSQSSPPPPSSPVPSPVPPSFAFPEDLPDEALFEPEPAKSVVGLDFTPPPAKVESPDFSTLPPSPPSATEPKNPEPGVIAESESIAPSQPDTAGLKDISLDALFAGEADSLVAIAVGSAEGTRTPHGEKNPAYYGHTDPGNGVWNLGSFSYQHGAATPEEADVKQLARLRSQAETIARKAADQGLVLSLEEQLNGIDLANQAPKAVLDNAGYVEWLAEAHKRGMTGSEAILWARVQSFIDPYTQTWDAPGLGNSESRITRDQERRMLEIAKAIQFYPDHVAQFPERTGSDRNQVSHRLLTEAEGIARLFAQPFTFLFGSEPATVLSEI
jgi:hypothetical protein